MKPNVIHIHPKDNVAVAIIEIKAGDEIVGAPIKGLRAKTDVPASHKVALAPIKENERVYKYGESIGVAKSNLEPGEWLHTHNIVGED